MKHPLPLFLIAVLILGNLVTVVAQFPSPDIRFKHLTIQDGLPSSLVRCILQDKKGFMWFGTGNGICRYDGYNFIKYTYNPTDTNSLSDNGVFCMIEDDEGKIWVGNRRTGITVFDQKTEKFTRYNYIKEDSSSLNYPDVRALCLDKGGDVWAATGKGLNQYDRKNNCFKQYNYNEYPGCPQNIFSLFLDKNSTLWIGAHHPPLLSSFNKSTKKFTNRDLDPSPWAAVASICEERNVLWLGTRAGLCIFNPVNKQAKMFVTKDNDPFSVSSNEFFLGKVFMDSKNQLWAGTQKEGLNIFNKEKDNFTRYHHNPLNDYSISSNSIRGIAEDDNGLLWIGTEDGGINIYNPRHSVFTVHQSIANIPSSLGGNYIQSIYEDKKGQMWIAIENVGLDVFNTERSSFYHYIPGDKYNLKNIPITSISEDGDGKIYITTDGIGAQLFDEGTNKFLPFPTPTQPWINCTFLDSKKRLWIGANVPGLVVYESKTKKFIHSFSTNDNDSTTWGLRYISVIFEDKQGNIWVGSGNSGLTLIDKDKRTFVHFKNDPDNSFSLSHNVVYSIYQDNKENIWIGTMTGLNQYDPRTKQFKRYYTKDGLPDNSIKAIFEDSLNNLWLGTTSGLCRFNPGKNIFHTYDVTDGLPSNEFTGALCRGKNGIVYLGTAKGMVSFNPLTLTDNSKAPRIAFTNFNVLNKPWELPQNIVYTNEITLSYREYFFSLEFAALDFSAPEKNQYAYKLDGFNKDWVYLGNKREVTFTNLDPGEYLLKIKASNNYGIWNEEGIALKIIITPPWWKTNWFYFLCFFFFVSGTYGIIKWRTASLIQTKKILETKVKDRTQELYVKNEKLSEAYKEIRDSINYAKRIQQAILPNKEHIQKALPCSFILYQPKDVVSGDFYFFAENKNKMIIAASDCTGHGVPGAFMSMIGNDLLNQIIIEKGIVEPAEILNLLNEGVRKILKQNVEDAESRDGMDIALCSIDLQIMELQYAGAFRPLYLIRGEELQQTKADKFPIGGIQLEGKNIFTNHRFPIIRGDLIYIFSDGYADQFGGAKQKKFMLKNFEQLLFSIKDKEMEEQKEILEKTMNKWKGNLEQVDDILVIGIRI